VPTLTCNRCGAPLPEDARFCPNCGAPVEAAVTEERRVVTILFADVTASTELAASLDAERFREVMAAFYRMVSTELASLRGRAEKFVGDAVMAVFGLPRAHEDDALRAVRAGLVIRDRTVRLGEELGLPNALHVRVGVNSGAVATGSGPADQLLVSGAPVNLAARLQQAARPDEVLVGETTWQLVRHQVDLGEPRVVPARGFEAEITAWPVRSLSTRSARRTIPLVDRRRELALLREVFERTRETSRAHLFTLLGEGGIGKSRLAEELVAGLPEGTRVLAGRASVFEEDPTFAPLADLLRRELSLERDAPAEDVHERLEEVVAGCCTVGDVEQTAARLGLALGLGTQGPGEGRSYRAAEIRSGFLALLTGLARTAPVLILFEDLHLARPPLLKLVEEVAARARRLPVLILCVARDDLLDERPDWGTGVTDAFRLRLEPLPTEEARELAIVAGESIDAETAEQVALRAGGNPFFIVETTGMLLQEHAERRLVAPHSHLLPPTVQAVVASRIDHLPEPVRELFRKASVFPRLTFSLSELALIAPDQDLPGALDVLEEGELVVPDRDRTGVWRFRHALLRDVAYDSLPKRERLRLHLVVADGLAAEGGDRHPNSIAFHLERAARASLDLDPLDRTLSDRAIAALGRAGDRARRAMESATASDLYERALTLAGPEEMWKVREARVLAGLGESRYWLGEYEAAGEALAKALDVGAGDDWTEAHASRFLGDVVLNFHVDVDGAEDLFKRAIEAARRLGDRWAMARTLLMAGWAPFWRQDLDAARAAFEEALAIARASPERDRWAEARALTSLASVISPVGDEAECLALGEQALALGRDMGDRFTTAVGLTYVANSLRRMWRLPEAYPPVEEAIQTFRDLEARWELASALGDRGTLNRLTGRLAQAENDLEEALKVSLDIGDRSLVAWTVGELARVHMHRGDLAGARRVLEEPAVATLEDDASMETSQALLALLSGDPERGAALAVDLLERDRAGGQGSPVSSRQRNPIAARVWWVGRLVGQDMAGGAEEVERARLTLEESHWIASLREPGLWLPRLPTAPGTPGSGATGARPG
jgi:class 3 adenylate cyclase/tetratricopeptide (TPR) repeat protein